MSRELALPMVRPRMGFLEPRHRTSPLWAMRSSQVTLAAVVQKYPELDVAALLRHTSSIAALAELTGLDRRLLHRRCHSGLSISEADLCATAVGCHASEVWACWFDLMDTERRARKAARMRRYRQKPKAREAERAYKRRQYRETSDYHRAQARAYYWANRDRIRAAQRAYRLAKKAAA